jgi:hypothetical protein
MSHRNETIQIEPLAEAKVVLGNTPLTINSEIEPLRMNRNGVVTIDIPEDITTRNIYIDSLVADYHYTRLETNDRCLIGKIEKIVLDSSYLFIYDKQNNLIFKFDKDGRFLCKIGNAGKGPIEYNEAWDITINKETKEVNILDLMGRKIVIYDYNGKFIRDIPMYYLYTSFEYINDKIVANTGSSYNNHLQNVNLNQVIIAKQDQKPLYKGFAFPSALRDHFSYVVEQPLKKFNNDVYYNEILSDTIWQIKDSTVNAAFALNFLGRGNIYNDIDKKKFTDMDYKKLEENNTIFYGSYLVSKDYLYLQVMDKSRGIIPVFYSNISKKLKCGLPISTNKGKLIDMLIGNSVDFIIKDNQFVKVMQPYIIKQIVGSLSKKEISLLNKEEREICKSINELDNPILLTYSIKKF